MFAVLLFLIFALFFKDINSFEKHLETLTLEEKIGQLFIVPACPLREGDHRDDLRYLIEHYHIGGILLNQGTTTSQLSLIHQFKKISNIPLLCIQDGEWGAGMRVIDVINFPKNLTLGAVRDDTLLTLLGREIGKQCRLLGIHLNLAPVVDVNSNPANPIIQMRSFGEDSSEVSRKGRLIMEGIQSYGIMACAKHFPGHGDTSIDSHVDLPLVLHAEERLAAIELMPFKALIQNDVNAIMSAHLIIPELCEDPFTPVTFSKNVITHLLQKTLGFEGLIITDALNMKALTRHYSPEEIAIRALLAGHDLLLYGDHIAPNIDQILKEDVPRAFHAIRSAVLRGDIPQELIDERVAKILAAKARLKLFQPEEENERIIEEINSQDAFDLKRALFEEAVTVLRNENVIPLRESKLILLEWGEAPIFRSKLNLEQNFALDDLTWLLHIDERTPVIVSLAGIKATTAEYGFTSKIQENLMKLKELKCPVIVVLFGTPYSLEKIPLFDGIVVAYENEAESQEIAAAIIMGNKRAKGILPVSILPYFPRGAGLR